MIDMQEGVLRKATLGQQTADILRSRIIKGTYTQGVRLAEEELAKQFDVSRATIREAFQILDAEGLLIREVNKYTYVKVLTRKDVQSLMDTRMILEQVAINYCVEHDCVPSAELHRCVDDMKRYAEMGRDSWESFMCADIDFHLAVIQAMDNEYVNSFWRLIENIYRMAMYMIRARCPQAFFGTSELHRHLVDELEKKNVIPWMEHLKELKEDVNYLTMEIEHTQKSDADCTD